MIDGTALAPMIAAGHEHRAVLADVRLDRHADAFGLQHREPLGVELRRSGAGADRAASDRRSRRDDRRESRTPGSGS